MLACIGLSCSFTTHLTVLKLFVFIAIYFYVLPSTTIRLIKYHSSRTLIPSIPRFNLNQNDLIIVEQSSKANPASGGYPDLTLIDFNNFSLRCAICLPFFRFFLLSKLFTSWFSAFKFPHGKIRWEALSSKHRSLPCWWICCPIMMGISHWTSAASADLERSQRDRLMYVSHNFMFYIIA